MMHHVIVRITVVAIVLLTSLNAHAQCALDWDARMAIPGGNNDVFAAAVFNDADGATLYIGGSFNVVAGASASYIARFAAGRWQPVGAGLNGPVRSMAVFDDGNGAALYVSGDFTETAGSPLQGLAKWNGAVWSNPPGGGANNTIFSLQTLTSLSGAPRLYASGSFTQIGGVSGMRLAEFNGTAWSSLNGEQFTFPPVICDYNDPNTIGRDLHIMGSRILPGGGTQQGLWRLNGALMILMSTDVDAGQVSNMIEFDDGNGPAMYVGGSFSTIGTQTIKSIAKWNGLGFSDVGGGLWRTDASQVYVLGMQAFDDGSGPALYVGGFFNRAGTLVVENSARWNGSAWSSFGPVTTNPGSNWVRDFAPWHDGLGTTLVTVGQFQIMGGLFSPNIIKWDGVAISPIGPQHGCGDAVRDMLAFNDGVNGSRLAAVGDLTRAGGVSVKYVAQWDGYRWSAMGVGFKDPAWALALFDDGSGHGPEVYAGGDFTQLNNNAPAEMIARWRNGQWEGIAGCPIVKVRDLAAFNDGSGMALYAVGEFGGSIARWNGTSWSGVGGGLNSHAYALHVHDDGSGPALYVGGIFTLAGGQSANRIARWNGAWSALGNGLPGPGFPMALSMCSWNSGSTNMLVVGGAFHDAGTVAAENLALWDGAAWSALPNSEFDHIVDCVRVHDDGSGPRLFAGGRFTAVSATTVRRVARWSGALWLPLSFGLRDGGGTDGVMCMQSFDVQGGSTLMLGGRFDGFWLDAAASQFRRSTNIARWYRCIADPSITDPPQGQTVPPGNQATMHVGAVGGALSYRWRHNGVPLENNALRTGVGATTFSIFNASESDSGSYDVVVQNAAGQVTSVPVTLNVGKPCPADISPVDGSVNVLDLLAVINGWGPCAAPCPPHCAADVDDNCQVNVLDLLAVINAWGPCP